MQRRSKALNLIKPANIDPALWTLLTSARDGRPRVVQRLVKGDPGLLAAEYWYTKALYFAVREGHLGIVQGLLEAGDDSSWIRYGHEDLVTVATDRGHGRVARCLIDDRKLHNVDETLPIHKAAAAGDVEVVAGLLARQASLIDVGDQEGWTPLHHAVHHGHFPMVAMLCEAGAEVDAIQRGGSADWYKARNQRPIDLAVAKGNEAMVGFLRAHRAAYTIDLAVLAGDEAAVRELSRSRHQRRLYGAQALALAARAGTASMVRVLLRSGVKPTRPMADAPDGAALWHAVECEHEAIAAMLLDAGADPNAQIESSGSALHRAKDNRMKALLYRFGAAPKSAADFVLDDNLDALAAVAATDPVSASVAGCGSVYTFVVMAGKTDMLDVLLSSGVPVPPVVTACRTYLWRRPKLTRRLLEEGAMDPNLPNWQWATPLHNVAEMNPMWVRKGPKSAAQKQERENRPLLVDLFLEFGAEIDAIDEEYRSSPLGWAARQGQGDVVSLLLERGADPNAGEVWARPLAWAERRGHHEIARRLRSAGAR